MSIAFDAFSKCPIDNGYAAATNTWSHSCAAGAVLLVFVCKDADANNRTVSSVTYNGVAMTEVLAPLDDSGLTNSVWLGLYMLHNPASGTHDIVVTWSGAVTDYQHGAAVSYTGVTATSVAEAHRTVYHGGADDGGRDLTVTDSQSGDVVVGSVFTFATSPTAGGTLRGTVANPHYTNYFLAIQDVAASGGSTVLSWDGDDACTVLGVALIPSSGGLSIPVAMYHYAQ